MTDLSFQDLTLFPPPEAEGTGQSFAAERKMAGGTVYEQSRLCVLPGQQGVGIQSSDCGLACWDGNWHSGEHATRDIFNPKR
jgi:hypothetical protein